VVRPRRRSDEDACVALLRQAGAVCGHVALARPHPGAAATAWAAELSVPASDLICVSLLFVGPRARGGGAGGSLLDTALSEIRSLGAAAVLEVVSRNEQAIALYRARGWRQIGSVQYEWLPQSARCLLYVAPMSTR